MEKEVEWLQGEKRQLEAHINRTEIWGENLGKWRAVVQSVEVNMFTTKISIRILFLKNNHYILHRNLSELCTYSNLIDLFIVSILRHEFQVPDEKEPPQFVMVVHMLANDTVEGEEDISTGWVVCRSLCQFQELHRKLRTMCSEIKSLELPSNTFKFLFGKTDRASLEKAKQQIQKYLEVFKL